MHKASRKRKVELALLWLIGIATFGYSYFRAVHKSWSGWQSVALSLIAGIVVVSALWRVGSRGTRPEKRNDCDDEHDVA